MQDFPQLTKTAFENYHNMPYEPAKWTLTDALGHIMQFLEHHDSIDEMSGLRQAIAAMTPTEWEEWARRYPHARANLIEPLRQAITTQRS
jgi:hypothetical protein